MSHGKVSESFHEVLRGLLAAIQALYRLAPMVVIVLVAVASGIVFIAIKSTALMVGVVVLTLWRYLWSSM
jgi:hypothetical protein